MSTVKERVKKLILDIRENGPGSQKNVMLSLYIVVIVLVNLVSLNLYMRFDLTGNNAYSLSETSREIVSSLESPLTVRVFFTEDLPAPYNNVKRYLSDILEEYQQYGNRNFRYVFIDPSHEKNKKQISDYGMRSVKVGVYKSDQISERKAYMGIAIEHEDLLEKIDSLTTVEGMEYRITSLIKKMAGKVDALHRVKDPINVFFYASKNVPDLQTVFTKVKARVDACNVKNYNKLKFQGPIDPFENPAAMETAKMYGIQKLTLRDMRGRSEDIMLGLVVEHKGRFETVHMIGRSYFSLYSVIESLDGIVNSIVGSIIGINPVIGYSTGHDEMSFADMRDGAVNFRPLVPDMYDFQNIDLSKDDIPESIQTLVINGPKKEFSELELFKIDQFLMKGRSVVLFLDSFREAPQQFPAMMQRRSPSVIPNSTGIEKLIAHYGVSVTPKILLDMQCLHYRGESLYMVPKISEDSLSRENEITRNLKQVYFAKASPVVADDTKLSENGAAKTVLVSSSPDSWLVTSIMPYTMFPPKENQRSQHNLAVLVSGRFRSYFSGRDLPAFSAAVPQEHQGKGAGAKIETPSFMKKTVKPGKLLVIGTSEITRFDYQHDRRVFSRPNAIFVQNVIDYMNGNYGMPEMRSKGLELNPIRDDNILAMAIKKIFSIPLSDAMDWAKIVLKLLNILILPALVLAVTAGVMYTHKRKQRARIKSEFGKNREVE